MISKNEFEVFCSKVFNLLEEHEQLSLNLSLEKSIYMRFSQAKVRQIGSVNQIDLKIDLLNSNKSLSYTFSLDNSLDSMLEQVKQKIKTLREEIKHLPQDPYFIPLKKGDSSEHISSGELLSEDQVVSSVVGPLDGIDAAGIYCSGKTIRALFTSTGQKHWFENDSFFLDFSFYTEKQKSVKANYSGTKFDIEKYIKLISQKKSLLKKVSLNPKEIKPSKYRVYFEPAAVSEILSMISWGGLSFQALKRGQSPLLNFSDNTTLSDKFTLFEDLSMGFAPKFNNYGEVAKDKLSIFERGKLINTLVSSRSAKEYDVESNFARQSESPRSLNLMPGNLEQIDILEKLDKGIYISNLHYLNWSDMQKGRITGMTRYACFWVENGQIVAPIKDLRFDESFYNFFGKDLVDLTVDTTIFADISTYDRRSVGAICSPGLIAENFSFTL